MELSPDQAQRLADAVRRRRLEFPRLRQRDAAELAGFSEATWRKVESGRDTMVSEKTLAGVDRALRWQPGGARAALDGGTPAELPRESGHYGTDLHVLSPNQVPLPPGLSPGFSRLAKEIIALLLADDYRGGSPRWPIPMLFELVESGEQAFWRTCLDHWIRDALERNDLEGLHAYIEERAAVYADVGGNYPERSEPLEYVEVVDDFGLAADTGATDAEVLEFSSRSRPPDESERDQGGDFDGP